VRFLRQGITITGLGTPTFKRSADAAKEIYELFQHQYPKGKLESWSPGTYRGFTTLEISNRYFTLKRDTPDMEHVPFDKLVDPFGILEGMIDTGYVHGEENRVRYFACEKDKDRNDM
jgi:hypothetical protein